MSSHKCGTLWWSFQVICRHSTISQEEWNLLIPVPTGERKCYFSRSPIKKEHLAKMDNLKTGAWEFRESRWKHSWVCHTTRMWSFLSRFSFNFHSYWAAHMWTRNQDKQNINWLLQMFSPWNKNYLNSVLTMLVYCPPPKSMFCQEADR